MTKQDAIALFGSTRLLAGALGISAAAIRQWPAELTQRQTHEVLGAALQSGRLSCRQESPGAHYSVRTSNTENRAA